MSRKSFTLAALIALAALAVPSFAQVPKPGKPYVDAVDVGFSIKMPDGWDFIPPQPNERIEIGSYSNGSLGTLRNPKNGQPIISMDVRLLKFDRRPPPAATATAQDGEKDKDKHVIEIGSFGPKDFSAWLGSLRGGWKQREKKELTFGKTTGTRYLYTATLETIECAFLAYEYKLAPEFEVVAVFFGPGDVKHWGKYENAYDAMGRSFKVLEVATPKREATGPRGTSPRDLKRYELEQVAAKSQGWKLYETPNYFVISSKNDDQEFLKELMDRLEAIHAVYEDMYPAKEAIEMRRLAKEREPAKPTTPGEPGTEPKQAPVEEPEEEPEDTTETANCSVVRVCKDAEEYHGYGGPGGSAGYWSSSARELVVYDDQASGGRRNTWAVINHEAFHQYIYYFFGKLAPHSWYNEGTGDYFSGYQYEHRKFTVKPFDWREREIQQAILAQDKLTREGQAERAYVPLKELVRYTQAEYYGSNKYKIDGGANYSQGWSLIYFLRTGAKKAKGWNPAWDSILATYLRTLVETNDLDKAVDKAFQGVDWDELEKCWKDYILKS